MGTCYFWNYKLHTPYRLPTICHSEKFTRAYYICFSWWPGNGQGKTFSFCDVNVTREYCSVYLIDPSKHTVSLVKQARVCLGMKLFTYLFLFSQFFNIQKVFGAIHPTWNMLFWKDIFYSLHDNWLMLGFQENQCLFLKLPIHIHCMRFAENKENKFVGRVAVRRGWRPFLGPIFY